ncbi:hypothetical protein DID88_000577 [Monilinia fructigena]|uniref:Uncharacterized protein n=1 Tax=Monilinia fructigena TaxID=38457 RepID=A0A395IID9_9HELO|nr:hypothetical protein DID88_000577 [Monilinia fructigena]
MKKAIMSPTHQSKSKKASLNFGGKHQRSSKLRRAKDRSFQDRLAWSDESVNLGRDAGRADDKNMTMERRGEREDNAPAETLLDLT